MKSIQTALTLFLMRVTCKTVLNVQLCSIMHLSEVLRLLRLNTQSNEVLFKL